MKIPVGLRLSPEIIKLYKEIAKKNKWSINTCIEEAVKLLHAKEINIVKKNWEGNLLFFLANEATICIFTSVHYYIIIYIMKLSHCYGLVVRY